VEVTKVTCDRCRRSISAPRLYRARIRFSKVGGRSPYDCCHDCEMDLAAWLRLAPEDQPKPDTARPPARRTPSPQPPTKAPAHKAIIPPA